MTKRQKRSQIQSVQRELVSKLQKRFRRTELLEVEERPDGIFALHLYAPYSNMFALLDTIGDRLEELADKGLYVLVLPHARRPATTSARRAAA